MNKWPNTTHATPFGKAENPNLPYQGRIRAGRPRRWRRRRWRILLYFDHLDSLHLEFGFSCCKKFKPDVRGVSRNRSQIQAHFEEGWHARYEPRTIRICYAFSFG